MTRVGATRIRMRRPERRAAIIDGAAAAFARGGYAATSMADVAAAAGVSHLIVYRHFESKEVLYEAVLERALELLARALSDERAVGSYGPTPAALLARRVPIARCSRFSGGTRRASPTSPASPTVPETCCATPPRPRSLRTSHPSIFAGRPEPRTRMSSKLCSSGSKTATPVTTSGSWPPPTRR